MACEGKSAAGIVAMFDAVLPREREMSGPMLPLLTEGPLTEFPYRVHDIVVGTYAMYAAGSSLAFSGNEPSNEIATFITLCGETALRNSRGINVGSEQFYGRDVHGASPYHLKEGASRVAPATLWRTQGLSGPADFGTGYSGLTPRKGNMPATIVGGAGATSPARGGGGTDAPALTGRGAFPAEEREAEEVE